MAKKSLFTSEQQEYILKNYKTKSKEEMMKILPPNSWKAAVNFASRHNIPRKVDFRGELFTTKFTKAQDELLKLTYPTYKKEHLLELFPGFTWNALVRHADLIGGKRNLSFIHKNYRSPRDEAKTKQKYKQTCIEKYGTPYPNQSQAIKTKRKQTRIDNKTTRHILSTGETLYDFANRKNINYSQALSVFKKYGEKVLVEYYENYAGPKSSTLEEFFLKSMSEFPITRHNKYTDGMPRKPDFKIEINEKVLYINTDGLYHHCELKHDNKNYHYQLQRDFTQHNLRIMQFREDEILYKLQIVKSIIANYFGNTTKYNARECHISQVDSKISQNFFETNHLMGYYQAATTYGLYKGEELVCCISLRYSESTSTLEIARFGSKNFTSIRGGFSKLLSYVTKNYDPAKTISFCDLRYATGFSYEKLGFSKKSTTLGWRWTDFTKTYNRLQCRANMDDRKLTQDEQAKELDWYKIYDAGQVKYEKIHKKILEDTQYLSTEEFCDSSEIKPITPKSPSRRIQISTNDIFNFWTVVEVPAIGQFAKCRCECGTEKLVKKNHLRDNLSKSCGCKRMQLCEETSIVKYGTKRASQTEEVKQKIDNMCIKKYGVKRASQVLQKRK